MSTAGQDAVDAGGENRRVLPRSSHGYAPAKQEAEVVTDEYFKSDYYNMEHRKGGGNRGHAVILSVEGKGQTGKDAEKAKALLEHMGFTSIWGEKSMIKRNPTKRDMVKELEEAASRDHKNNDCFVCVILSHGEEGYVCSEDDEKVEIDDLAKCIKGNNCKSLIMKPKLFFIQSCDKKWLEVHDGVPETGMEADDMATEKRRIPAESDFLMMYSTVPVAMNKEDQGSSYFINFLHDVFTAPSQDGRPAWQTLDLFSLLTRVNRRMSNKLEQDWANPFRAMKYKLPVVTSMLTKDLIFKPIN